MFYSPDGAFNHWFDQAVGDSIACGNWFYHLTGLYAFSLASLYGLSMYTLSDYSDTAFLGTYTIDCSLLHLYCIDVSQTLPSRLDC